MDSSYSEHPDCGRMSNPPSVLFNIMRSLVDLRETGFLFWDFKVSLHCTVICSTVQCVSSRQCSDAGHPFLLDSPEHSVRFRFKV